MPATGPRSKAPTLRHERAFKALGARYLAGVDEVGRGALAGPVSVGIAVVDLLAQKPLPGVRDSKLLGPAERERLDPLVRKWSVASAVGHATAAEIDALGIIAALRLAGTRAWADVLAAGITPDVVLLDGSHNWLSPAEQPSLFDEAPSQPGCDAPVHTRVKADMQCLSVAAASVIAKVERDQQMRRLHTEFPDFGWDINKGYATPLHRDVLRAAGPTPYHRVSWRLLGGEL
ncbi:MAG TPA: ribonuclease HII [Arthrobacter sp.]|nr:ribonuclease HII [Arthrobacter sp.]